MFSFVSCFARVLRSFAIPLLHGAIPDSCSALVGTRLALLVDSWDQSTSLFLVWHIGTGAGFVHFVHNEVKKLGFQLFIDNSIR
jgi:hypothetical protein